MRKSAKVYVLSDVAGHHYCTVDGTCHDVDYPDEDGFVLVFEDREEAERERDRILLESGGSLRVRKVARPGKEGPVGKKPWQPPKVFVLGDVAGEHYLTASGEWQPVELPDDEGLIWTVDREEDAEIERDRLLLGRGLSVRVRKMARPEWPDEDEGPPPAPRSKRGRKG